MKTFQVSFLIPALNESKNIAECIQSIKEHTPENISYEIIVGDHGSTDETTKILETLEIDHFTLQGGTIATLRNKLVEHSNNEILIFLDADIRLSKEWNKNITESLAKESHRNTFITGSNCSPPNDPGVLNRHWFTPISKLKKNYVATGHMITTRETYKKIGGFTEALSSGEDYDFCQRAKKHNIPVTPNPLLKVFHLDFPNTLDGFIQREIWHGAGDYNTLNTFLSSKVAITSTLYTSSILIFGAALVISNLGLLILLATIIFVPPALLSFYKFREMGTASRLNNIAICAVYLICRSLSITKRRGRKRHYSKHN